MPRVTSGILQGLYLPDYDGGSIVNLLSSIVRSRGGRSPHRELVGLPASKLRGARNVVYTIIDGLGEAQLKAFLGTGQGRAFLARHDRQVISTVFPATTATAVTTFGTGASPAEHAILGWFLHLSDLGMVSAILLTTTRTGVPMAHADFDLGGYLRLPTYLDGTKGRRELVTPHPILKSRFAQLGTQWQKSWGYQTLGGMERHIVSLAKRRGRGLAYAYWPKYDGYCHEFGCQHALTQQHLGEIDTMLARLVQRLQGTDTMLVVLADHGLIDASPEQRIDLKEVSGLYDCLAALPSGDARTVSCFVRPARVKKFLSLVKRHLSAACVCLTGEELIDSGAFGPGRKHPALRNRVGDYVLLAKRSYAFFSTVPGSTRTIHVGNHGGMAEAEVLVPLYAVWC